MTESGMTKPTRGIALLVVGIVLTVIGVIAMFFFGFGTPGKDTALNNAVWETSLTIGSAIVTGVGILLILIAIVRRRRRGSLSQQGRLPAEFGGNPEAGTGGTSEEIAKDDRDR
ncbi:Asp23/Gls24 family envelope stress response protein [Humibacter ginsengisoli]